MTFVSTTNHYINWRSRMVFVQALSCALAWALCAGAGHAQDFQPHAGTWVVRAGAAGVLFSSSGKLTLGGQPLPGAGLKLTNDAAFVVAADYYVRPDLSLSVTVGAPPTTTAQGTGTLAPLGRLGSVRYGPSVALAKYHFGGLGRLQPWIGAGATRMIVFGQEDGAITKLHANPSWGAAVEGGGEYMLTPRWGLYASVSRLFLRTHGDGTFSGLPVTAKIAMDPTVVQGGLSFRF
jgi:outer membrane protein